MGGGHLWEVVTCGRRSLVGGGHLWEVVAHGGSTVIMIMIMIMIHLVLVTNSSCHSILPSLAYSILKILKTLQ